MSHYAMQTDMTAEDWNNFDTEPPIMDGPTDKEIAEAHKRADAHAKVSLDEAVKSFEDAMERLLVRKHWRGGAICAEALRVINGERQDAYGNPEDTFFKIACLWSSYLGMEVEGSDVANRRILLKMAREKGGKGKRDNYVDLIGYAALGATMRGYDK